MERGNVKWFNASKCFGFIQRDFGGDVIVHYNFINTNVFNTLNEGQEVECEIIETEKGPQARNVSLK